MADLTFKANLLPNTDLGKALGSENQRWNIYGKFAHTPNNTTTFLRGDNTFSNILTGNIYTKGYYMDQANPDSTETHKANIHLWGDVVAFTYRNSDNTYLGDAFYYNINNGDITAKHEVYITNGNLSVGTAEETTSQRRITLNSGSGDLILFSNASATGSRGLWVNAHGTGAGKNIITIDTNNNATFAGNADTATTATVAQQCSSANLTEVALSWHSSYTTGDWMLIHNGEKGTNGGELFRAINQANTAAWVDAQHKWVRIGGDTMTGPLRINGTDNSSTDARLYIDHRSTNDWGIIIDKNNSYDYGMIVKCNSNGSHGIDVTGRITGTKVYGAVWNDYAEYRKTCNAKPGQCVVEISNGKLKISNKRCLPAARVISDTFGFAIGETEECQTPIAVSGRVLVYIDNSHIKIGDAVCSGKNGTVSKMRWYERILYPERIVGIVSEIPDYDEWLAGERDGNHKIKVNGRIWIYVK